MACNFEERAAGNIERILIIYAMQAEASPLVDALKLKETNECVFPKGVPWVRYNGVYERLIVDIVVPGKDPVHGVDNVGTVSAALVTYAAIYALKPDLIINAGTAGGFKTKGACVGDVFVVEEVANHDRRIPIPFFEEYGIGATKLVAVTNLVKTIGLKVGKLSTGNSLDMSPHDEQLIKANDAAVKDMEGAAVAYVANLFSVPAILFKSITDIIDGDKATEEEFLENLSLAASTLLTAIVKSLKFLQDKRLSDL